MNEKSLKNFYEKAIIPQFDLVPNGLVWGEHKKLGPDEDAFYFTHASMGYILIWEDFNGAGESPAFIEQTLGLTEKEFEFMKPIATEYFPSIRIRFGETYAFVQFVTGSFTLLKLK